MQVLVVEHLAVEDDPVGRGGAGRGTVGHRLPAGLGQIEDRQAPRSKAHAGGPECACVVGSAMEERVAHRHDLVFVDGFVGFE